MEGEAGGCRQADVAVSEGTAELEALQQNLIPWQVLPGASRKVVWSVSKGSVNSNPAKEPQTLCVILKNI